jgi:hypothetical protein
MLLARWLTVMLVALALPAAAAGPPKPDSVPEFAREDRTIPDTPAGAKFRWLLAALNGDPAGEPADNFTPDFLRELPPAKITAMLRDIAESQAQSRAGSFVIARINPGQAPTGLVAILEITESGNLVRVELGVDPKSGKIDFLAVTPFGGGGDEGGGGEPDPLETLRTLPGNVSLFAVLLPPADDQTTEPARVLEYQPELTLAIGSAFKLWVLGALGREAAQGAVKWDQPQEIRASFKSLPSGDMHLQPEGATFPVSTFADKMMSISDNTAADHLIHMLGRDKVEAFMASCTAQPRLNQPLLTTREMFTLKLPGDPNLPLKWNVASERTRRRMIADGGAVAKAEPDTVALTLWTRPIQIENIEWFASTPDLCKAVHELRKLGSLPGMEPLVHAWTLNPGVEADRNVWHRIAFKGGSEPGVLCFTWMLERDDGRAFALAMSWNLAAAPLNETRFAEEARKVLDHLAKVGRTPGNE